MAQIKKNESIVDESRLDRALAEAKEIMSRTNSRFGEAMKEIKETYNNQKKETETLTSFLKDKNGEFSFRAILTGNIDTKRKQIENKYSALGTGIDGDTSLSDTQKESYKAMYGKFMNDEINSANDDSIAGKTSKKLSTGFSNGLQDMIMGYKNFSDVMRGLTNDLTNYILKQFTDNLLNSLFSQKNIEAVSGILGSLLDWGTGGVSSVIGFASQLFKRHSGGVIPSGANYSLPGTQEQLALLKGGERVLSPSENVSYENQGGGSPVVFNNFNVKAWDSKDVSKYLLENRELLNSITFEGIKNNNGHLRTMVRNA